MKKIEYLPLNWPNGLKLTGRHFVHVHNELVESLQHLREDKITSYNYGLGAVREGQQAAVELDIAGFSAEGARICLKYCNAITRSGHSIFYDKDLYGSYRPEVSLSCISPENVGSKIYIVVRVFPYETLPVGYPDPEVVPLHHPYVLPKIELCLLPANTANAEFLTDDCLVIGCGKIDGHLFIMDSDYIPPTQRVIDNQILSKVHQTILAQLNQIATDITQIYGKNSDDYRKSRLTDSLLSVCRSVQTFVAQHFFDLEHLTSEHPPIYLLQKINILTRTITSSLYCLPTKDFELLLQYIYEWTDISPSELEATLNSVTSLKYDHLNLARMLEVCRNLMQKLVHIFRKMSELEYVGLIRENIIISDDSYQEQNKPRKTFRFLD